MEKLSQEMARNLVEFAVAEAKNTQSPSSVAVVDSGRNLICFTRMDKAPLASIEISIGKAYTARSLNMPTANLTDFVQPGQPLYGISVTHRQPLVTFGGGIPIELDGEIVGALGVAGGTVDQDVAVASGALKKWFEAN